MINPDQLQLDFSESIERSNEAVVLPSAKVIELGKARRLNAERTLRQVYDGIFNSIAHINVQRNQTNHPDDKLQLG